MCGVRGRVHNCKLSKVAPGWSVWDLICLVPWTDNNSPSNNDPFLSWFSFLSPFPPITLKEKCVSFTITKPFSEQQRQRIQKVYHHRLAKTAWRMCVSHIHTYGYEQTYGKEFVFRILEGFSNSISGSQREMGKLWTQFPKEDIWLISKLVKSQGKQKWLTFEREREWEGGISEIFRYSIYSVYPDGRILSCSEVALEEPEGGKRWESWFVLIRKKHLLLW